MSYTNSHYDFLFASLNEKQPNTARKVHLRRLYDLFYLSAQRHDFPRAYRAWCILARCKEFQLKTMWKTALYVLAQGQSSGEGDQKRIDFLKTMMLRFSDQREAILKELITALILAERHREALDELELYLPSFPYQDNPIFHIYAGLLALYMAQIDAGGQHGPTFDRAQLQEAHKHFEQAIKIDPHNAVANLFLQKVSSLASSPTAGEDSEDDLPMDMDDDEEDRPKRKRMKS